MSVKDANGNTITDQSHIANLNSFRYRSYYYDTETGLYYLMSRYYDPETGRFINADGYVSTGTGLLDTNMFAYCGNNPIMCSDPTGELTSKEIQNSLLNHGSGYTIMDATRLQRFESNIFYRKNNNFAPRKDKRKGSEQRQQSGQRERNVGHPNGEEHSRVPKGNGLRRIAALSFTIVAVAVAVVVIADDGSGIGVFDDIAIPILAKYAWDICAGAF